MRRLFAVLITAVLAPFVLFAYAIPLAYLTPSGTGFPVIFVYPLTPISLWLIYKGLRKIE